MAGRTLDQFGTGKKIVADGTTTCSPLKPETPASLVSPLGVEETPEQRLVRLEAGSSKVPGG